MPVSFSMRCPRCNTTAPPIETIEPKAWICANCSGTFDDEEVARIREISTPRECPNCHVTDVPRAEEGSERLYCSHCNARIRIGSSTYPVGIEYNLDGTKNAYGTYKDLGRLGKFIERLIKGKPKY